VTFIYDPKSEEASAVEDQQGLPVV